MDQLLRSAFTRSIVFLTIFQLLWLIICFFEAIPTWKLTQKIVLVALLALCIIIFGFILYHLWFRKKYSFLIKIAMTSVGIWWYTFLLFITMISDEGLMCTRALTFEHTYPHDKTIYVFHYSCVPDGYSMIYIREGVLPVMKEIGLSPHENLAENASLYIEQKGDVLSIKTIGLVEYNLKTGKAIYQGYNEGEVSD